MTIASESAPHRDASRTVHVADESLTFRPIQIDDLTSTGAQLALAAGFKPAQGAVVLQLLASGELEDIRPAEAVDLRLGTARFVIVEADREFLLTVDGLRFSWPCRIVSGATIRKLGQVTANKAIYEQLQAQAERLVDDQDLVDLDGRGIESFVSRHLTWKLNVQGVILDLDNPTILVSTALTKAGFDPTQGWHIYLKVAGQPKQEKSLTDTVDLRTPGVEKLRLTPKEVTNGDVPPPRRAFALLDSDEEYLERLGRWETLVDGERRWLLIHNYPVPTGYTIEHVVLALDIPTAYPGAQIDMFYSSPPMALISGGTIPSIGIAVTIAGVSFSGWSRHRGPTAAWNAATDNVVTHLALVDAALMKEVGE